ncbi:hypothetical protein A3850_011580 [Lewinella sp. 4G2]|nr:hypothetical protein A3850_011580 [Lewinella sp. 4G2]
MVLINITSYSCDGHAKSSRNEQNKLTADSDEAEIDEAEIVMHVLQCADSLGVREYFENSTEEFYGVIIESAWGDITGTFFFRNGSSYFAFNKDHAKTIPNRPTYFGELDEYEWVIVTDMIDEYDFWEETAYKLPEPALDGFSMFVIGKNQKRSNSLKAIFRGTPEYDKIGSLGSNLRRFEKLCFEQDTLGKGSSRLKSLKLR